MPNSRVPRGEGVQQRYVVEECSIYIFSKALVGSVFALGEFSGLLESTGEIQVKGDDLH